MSVCLQQELGYMPTEMSCHEPGLTELMFLNEVEFEILGKKSVNLQGLKPAPTSFTVMVYHTSLQSS